MTGWFAELLGWLELTPLAQAMRTSLWLYPIVEIFHIAGFTLLVGAVAMFDMRLFGWSLSLPVTGLAWPGMCCRGRWPACCSSFRPGC